MASKLFDALFKQSAHIKKLADGNIEFALNLYQKIIQKDEEANTFLSPFSITVALAMIGAGAQSKTAEELINTLKLQSFEEDLKNLHSAFEDVLHSFGSDTTPIAFRFANGIFLQESYPILEDFRSILSRYYHAEVNPENFVLDHDTARKEINQWVEEKTLQKIKNLLPPEAVNRFTRLILISAVHFKGEWEVQFNPKRTSKGDFHRNSEDNVPASFMRIKKSFPYAEPPQLQCQVVELPYRGKRLGMIVLLPKNPEGLPELEKQLTAKQLKDIVSSLRTTEVWVVLPKFRLEIGTPLTEVLKKLGIQELFGEGRADLTGISTAGDLFVSDAIHKAYLEVNEEGTEAAAATAVVVNRLGMGRSIIPEFTANHPFLFLIYDKATEMILFMGRLTDPPQMV